ncbi:hypothetical protein BsWGS_05214 [Bradybaena similaris]
MVEEGTRSIVVDYIKYRLDCCGFQWENDGRHVSVTPNPVQEAMRRLGDAFEERYRNTFSDMIQKLNVTEDTAAETFTAIMDEIFTDGVVNWGRVVALFGFTGRFVVYCWEHNMQNMVDNIVELVTSYVDTNLRDWMQEHNHWNGFLEFQATESALPVDIKWPSLGKLFRLAVAGIGVITLGALFTHRS